MIKVTETEYNATNTKPKEEKQPINGYSLNKNVSCLKCKYFKTETYHNEGGYSPTEEICSHEENVQYTYDYKGKNAHLMLSPKDRNKNRDCELYEAKKTIMQNIKIKLGIMG